MTNRDDILARAADPVLSFDYIIEDLGISKATFHRRLRHVLPVVHITENRLGVRQSDYLQWKSSRVRYAPGAAA